MYNTNQLTDPEINQLLQQVKNDLKEFPEGSGVLETECETSAKHILAYLKIVKGHITQLAEVLQTDNHQNRTLENTTLAEPVKQLIEIFNTLHDDDIHLLESLALSAKQWNPEQIVSIHDYAPLAEA